MGYDEIHAAFDELIGGQLLAIDNGGFSVKLKNGETRHYEFTEDDGDCCGYATITGKMLVEDNSARNPIITNVEIEGNDGAAWRDYVKICLFGGNAILAEIESTASSGSGWYYGACAWITCRETEKDTTITSW